jgi:hypothetical protein
VTADRTKITEERTRSQLLTESLLRFTRVPWRICCRRVLEKRASTVDTFDSGFCAIFIIVEPFLFSAF